jgi:hypothetical protein
VAPPPAFQPPPAAPDAVEEETESPPPVVRRIEHDHEGGQTRVVTAYGYRYAGPHDARIEESYEGLVGVSHDTPGNGWASARTRYSIRWPETSVSTEARLRFRSTATTYRVAIDVIAAEDGADGIGRVERSFEREIPRRLQ